MNDILIEGIPSADNALKLLARYASQIPFAVSVALNKTADKVTEAEVVELKQRFKLRREWYKRGTRFGVNVTPSNKANLTARVFSKAPWLIQQDEGGNKKAGRHPSITIPDKGIRQSSDRLIPKKLSPAKVMKQPKKFRAFKAGDVIFERFGPGRRDIHPLFYLKANVQIPRRFDFVGTGKPVVLKEYQQQFGKALAFAIATAKP